MSERVQPYERIDRDVTRRYEVDKRIGRGCYGVVFEAHDAGTVDGPGYAIKKVLWAFRNAEDAQRTYREICYMLEFGGHDNITAIHDVLVSPDDKHIYIVSNLMDSDLQKTIRCQALKSIHRPLIAYQVLRALKYIHSAGVMHRDVKPSNVLLNTECHAELCDFGWARSSPMSLDEDYDAIMTEYAATRWYRAPEEILGARRYTLAVDAWAFGALVGEMHSEKPLLPGTSTLDMLEKIMEMFGKPLTTDVDAMEAKYGTFWFEPYAPTIAHRPVSSVFPDEKDVELVDFIELVMQYNPNKRLMPAEAMEHPYLAAFHNPDAEPDFGRKLTLTLHDKERMAPARYRDQIYADVIGIEVAKRRVQAAEMSDLELGQVVKWESELG